MTRLSCIRFPLAAALALGLLAPTVAGAAHLATAALSFQRGFGTHLECKIRNVANSPRKVRIQAVSEDGVIGGDSGLVALGSEASLSLEPNAEGGRYWCRFGVLDGSRDVRAIACTVWGDECVAVLPAE